MKVKRIVSLHWGLIPGGGAAYARCLEDVGRYAPLSIKSLCITAAGWPVYSAGLAGMDVDLLEIKGRMDPSWIGRARHFLKKQRPDLILTHGFNGAYAALLSTTRLNVPMVSSWHGEYFPSTPAQRLRKPFFNIIERVLFSYVVKEIVTVSDFSRNVLIRKGISGRKITVIHNGIPDIPRYPENRPQMRNSLQIPEGSVLVGTACRLAAQKGLQWLLRASAIVLKARRDVHFVIWGDGPLKQSLQNLSNELGVSEYVHFAGYQPNIEQLLPGLDVFVMSSFAEYFSIALLEALRAGLPIVATNVGGNPEAIQDGVHGILVPFADAKALAEGILTLAESDKPREQMRANARQRFLDQFTAETMVSKTARWLSASLQKHAIPSKQQTEITL